MRHREEAEHEWDSAIRITRASMADGRYLVYFDDAGSRLPEARLPDLRELAPRPPVAQLRRDSLTGEWVSVAAARQERVMLPPAHLDPLAPQTPDNPSEIPSPYDVVVFENRSPSFGPPADAESGPEHGEGEPTALAATAIGRCEVVSFSPDLTGSLGTQGTVRVRTVIEAWAHRTAELSELSGVRQVFPFENRGADVGVTLHHPHGQIYAYPFVTPRTARVQAAILSHGPDLFARILERELAGPRLIATGEHWSAFVPFAARWPIEIHVLPHRDIPDFAHTSLAERAELAVLYPRLLQAVDGLYGDPTPYIGAWHQAPVGGGDGIRLMAQITSPRRAIDKLKFLAGSEAAMGAWVTDVVPEETAARLRDAYAAVAEGATP